MKKTNRVLITFNQKKFIMKAYDEYHKFAELKNRLPNFELKTIELNNGILANHRMIDGKHILSIDTNLYKLGDTALPYLFHEFTHLFDYETYFKCDKNQEMLLKFFTEYSATQIEFMKILGFNTISDKINLTPNTILQSFNKIYTVEDYLLNERTGYINRIKSVIIERNMQELFDAFPYMMYYIGKISIIIKNTGDIKEWNPLLFDYSDFCNMIGDECLKIIENLFQLQSVTIETLEPIIKLQLDVMRNFKPMQ